MGLWLRVTACGALIGAVWCLGAGLPYAPALGLVALAAAGIELGADTWRR